MIRKMRGRWVAEMLRTLAAEGIIVDEGDISILFSYMKGKICERDMLAHVCQFDNLELYNDWLNMTGRAYFSDGELKLNTRQTITEVKVFIRSKNSKYSNSVNNVTV